MIDKKRLQKLAAEYGAELNEQQLFQFDSYAELLCIWNQRMNLTAITDAEGILQKHFLDSLTVLPAIRREIGKKESIALIDVGSGAGFPGIPLAITAPKIRLTALDTQQKRLNFISMIAKELNLSCETIHARAEDAGQQEKHRGKYNVVTARAVAELPILCELCLPLTEIDGIFLSMRGQEGENEAKKAEKAIQILGGEIEEIQKHILPGEGKRAIIMIRKRVMTPKEYPRKPAKIAKQSL